MKFRMMNDELFHVKHRVFVLTLSLSNARLNHRRKATGLVPCMFQPSEQRPRGENAMFRPSCLNRHKPAKIAPFPGFKTARPTPTPFP